MADRPKIVIVGGGCAGLQAARVLGRRDDVAGMDGTGAHMGSTSWRMGRTAASPQRRCRQRGT